MVWLLNFLSCQTSTVQGSAEEEWASEAVQLGGVASGMGSLGFWTGANHQEDDPIGTCPGSSFNVLWM